MSKVKSQRAALGRGVQYLRTLCLTVLVLLTFTAHGQTATTTTIGSSANPVAAGQTVTFTVMVEGASPTGKISFRDSDADLATVAMMSGTASYSTVLAVGNHSITARYSGDEANGASTSVALIQVVDKIGTAITLQTSPNPSIRGQGVDLIATVTGNGPGGSVTFKDGATVLKTVGLNGNMASYRNENSLSVGSHSLTAEYSGDASYAASASGPVVQVVNLPATATTIASTVNPSTYGQSASFIATVMGSSPTGSVTFMSGAASFGTAPLTGKTNSRSAMLATTTLIPPGGVITAVYGGDGDNASSTSSGLIQIVNRASSSTAMAINPNPSTYGQGITLTATVTSQSTTGGSVTFMDGGTVLGTAANSGGGIYRLNLASLGVGSHSITAAFAGDTYHLASTSPAITQNVSKAASSTTLSTNANPVAYGNAVTLTAIVAGQSPTGSVTFMEGVTTLGTAVVIGGVASIPIFLSVATHNVTAVYSGDANHGGSSSNVLPLAVIVAVTTANVLSSANPASFGQSVTLSAAITGQVPSGMVVFKDGAATLGAAPLNGTGNSQTAALTISSLSVGSHSITAAYTGDTNNAASTSSALAQTITRVMTTSAVSSGANPATFGQDVSLAASISGNAPTGDVTFKDGTIVLGTATLAGTGNTRTAGFISNALAVGSHSITVAYAGDTNNAASTSAALTQVIDQVTSTSSVASSSNPATYGQTVTFTASVTGNAPGGDVSFKDGASVLGAATLTGTGNTRTASFPSSALSVGSHSITVTYAGDTNNAASTAAPLAQAIDAQPTTTELISSLNPANAGQTVTWTATVNGGTDPAGTIIFKDGSTVLGTATLAGRTAGYSSNALVAGSHAIIASYAGDANNAASTSATLTQSITDQPVNSLRATPNPAVRGQSVTLLVQISGNNPTGTITFMDGATTLGSASLSGGAASLSLNSLATGAHSLSASYTGDAGNPASTSNAVSLTVNAQNPLSWQYGYDATGRLTTTVDPNGLTNYFYYDSLGRRIRSQQPANAGSSTPTLIDYGYNLADSLTGVTDPRALSTTYSVSGLGTMKEQSSPDTGVTQNTFDAKGNLTGSIDARGKLTSYRYDVLDRTTEISYATGTPTTFEYDGGANPTPAEKGELTKMTDESGQTRYSYDSLGRLTSKAAAISGKSFTVGYIWGDAGSALDKLIAITYPGGSRVNYAYDDKGRVNAITVNPISANGVGVSGSAQVLVIGITHNADGKVTGWQWSDGKARLIGYDSVGQVSSYTLGDPQGSGYAAGALRSVSRDSAGRITGYVHVNPGSPASNLDQTFGYDNLNRLMTATVNGTSYLYEYDETGNRKSKTIGGTSYTNTIAATSNRLTRTQDVGGTATIVHDAAGHITSDGTNTYVYSDRGRMVSAGTPSGTITFTYNGLGQRARKTGPGATSYYVYGEAGQLLGEYDGNGVPVYETIYLGTTPVGVMRQTGAASTNDIDVKLYNVSADHIDTPRLITRQDQAIVWRWDTAEAFGATAPNENPSRLGAFVFNQRFPGQVFDAETGLNQNWNREYNARTGRYIQSDPIGLAGSINAFAYVESMPITTIDPTGEFGIAGALWGGGIDVVFQLLMNGGKLKCVNWKDVGLAAAGGSLTGGLLNGIGKIKKGVNTWNATSKWLKRSNGPGGVFAPKAGQQYHHWAIEQNSALGKMVPDAIKNQPWNLNPIPKTTHDLIHGNAPGGAQYGAFMGWWQGTPGWAKGVELGLGTAVLVPDYQGDECECQ